MSNLLCVRIILGNLKINIIIVVIFINKKIARFIGLLVITCIMLMPISVLASTKDFKFDMVHQLSIGTYKSTKDSVTATINMTAWDGDDYFTIHIYKKSFATVQLVDRLGFTKSSQGSPYTKTSYEVDKGNNYIYEIWKNQNKKRIKGSGSLSY